MKPAIVFCLLVISVVAESYAASEIISRRVMATGETRELAVINSVIDD